MSTPNQKAKSRRPNRQRMMSKLSDEKKNAPKAKRIHLAEERQFSTRRKDDSHGNYRGDGNRNVWAMKFVAAKGNHPR